MITNTAIETYREIITKLEQGATAEELLNAYGKDAVDHASWLRDLKRELAKVDAKAEYTRKYREFLRFCLLCHALRYGFTADVLNAFHPEHHKLIEEAEQSVMLSRKYGKHTNSGDND